MSKQDNLTDFLTDVANAIREKKGTTEKINPQNFSEEIKGIETGIVPCEFKDVNFYDYEGTILYSYTWDEFVAKNEMPPLPTHHEGLTCQEWNYTLEEVLEQGGRCDVGAIYTTSDNKLHFIIDSAEGADVYIPMSTLGTHIDVDWGDGETTRYGSNAVLHHVFKKGEYDITVTSEGEKRITIGEVDYFMPIKRIHFPAYVVMNIAKKTFSLIKCEGFTAATDANIITIPNTNHINQGRNWGSAWTVFEENNLISISLRNDNNSQYLLHDSKSIFSHLHYANTGKLLTWPPTYNYSVSLENEHYCAKGNCILSKMGETLIRVGYGNTYIASGVKIISSQAGIDRLTPILIPFGVEELGNDASVPHRSKTVSYPIIIPKTLTTIGSKGFFKIDPKYYDFRESLEIPIITGDHAFYGSTCKIVVPDALYDQWIAATNWSTYASRIVKASEFVEPTNE